MLKQLIQRKPTSLWLVSGDFNQSLTPFKSMFSLFEEQFTFKRRHAGGERQSRTDWTLAHNQIQTEHIIHNANLDLSDHLLIEIIINLQNTTFQPRKVYYTRLDRKQMLENCQKSETSAETLLHFLQLLEQENKKKPIQNKRKLRLI